MKKAIYTTPLIEIHPVNIGQLMSGSIQQIKTNDLNIIYGGGGNGPAHSNSSLWDDESEDEDDSPFLNDNF